MRGRESERDRQKWHRWLKETNMLPSLAKPRGDIPQSAINHMKMVPYAEVIKNVKAERPEPEEQNDRHKHSCAERDTTCAGSDDQG